MDSDSSCYAISDPQVSIEFSSVHVLLFIRRVAFQPMCDMVAGVRCYDAYPK